MRNKILLLGILIPALVEAGAWSFYGHDIQRTGLSLNDGPDCCNIVCQAYIEWSKASPVIDGNGHLYIQGADAGTWD